jgi:hypothetical protein
MKKFEYKFDLTIGESPDPGDDTDYTEEQLNELGAEGWELIAVQHCGKDNSYLGYWFKRELD